MFDLNLLWLNMVNQRLLALRPWSITWLIIDFRQSQSVTNEISDHDELFLIMVSFHRGRCMETQTLVKASYKNSIVWMAYCKHKARYFSCLDYIHNYERILDTHLHNIDTTSAQRL